MNKYTEYVKKISLLMQLQLRLQIRMNPSGLLGILLEPFLLIAAIYAIKTFFLRYAFNTYGLSTIMFIVCGVLPFYTCTRVAFLGLTFPNRYEKKLVDLPYIQETDIFISSGLNEARISLTIFLVFLYIEYIRTELIINNILLAITAMGLVSLIGTGFAINLSILVRRFPPIRFPLKFLIRRVLFWTSGLFYSLNSLPLSTKKFIAINPIIHAAELIRYSIHGDYPVDNTSIVYLINCATVIVSLALILSFTRQKTIYNLTNSNKDVN